ncbi:energy transducer TonB [Romeria aff. gracilis LEGE 07310]|uniref:Energy transducer TonB n=1 Tax=Vasconcelosia minhoensis LEGE 07310 TaxID=915328 RepID=A0A8J7DBP6_9CYAN|nr:energy transducer TonB [Romeria gracilis]MBE9076718.1 energy transducer TonB [Romeria aff. gracilis LEGE 07310]
MASTAPKTRFFPQSLLNPYSIAVLASVGVHGLFFAFGPRYSDVSFAAWVDGDATAAEPRNVPLVQLTPAEQSRLPNFSQTPFPLGLDRLNNPPGGFKPPSALTLPTPGSFGSFPNPASPGLQQAPSTFLPQPPAVSRSPFSAPPSITRFSVRNAPQVSRPPAGVRIGAIPNPPGQPPAQTAPETQAAPETSADATAAEPGSLPELPSGETRTLDELLAAPQNGSASSESRTALADALTGTDAATAAPGETTPDETALGETAPEQTGDELTAAAAPAEGDSGSRSRSLLAAYQYDPAGTAEADVSAAAETWLTAAREKVGSAELQPGEADLGLDANVLSVCLDTPPTDGLVGVLVGPEGRPQEVSMLGSTGYDILNSQALTAARNYSFPESDGPVPYQVKIDVDYDAEGCVNQLPETQE